MGMSFIVVSLPDLILLNQKNAPASFTLKKYSLHQQKFLVVLIFSLICFGCKEI